MDLPLLQLESSTSPTTRDLLFILKDLLARESLRLYDSNNWRKGGKVGDVEVKVGAVLDLYKEDDPKTLGMAVCYFNLRGEEIVQSFPPGAKRNLGLKLWHQITKRALSSIKS